MIKIGLVGFGVVNSGVYEIIRSRSEFLTLIAETNVEITKILISDIHKQRDKSVPKALFTDQIDDFFNSNLDIVIEAITNTEKAYEVISKALSLGLNTISASKAVISKYYNELFTLSKDNHCGLYIEAAVAGGVPVIKPILQTIKSNQIQKIKAILNGTTNFILSKMYNDQFSFKDALDLAQKLGYAEADPTDDVEGYDALRKLVILSNISYETRIYEEDIPCQGITHITKEDIEYIKDLGLIIKLIGTSIYTNEGISASIEPLIFDKSSVFNTVQLSNNIVSVTGNNVGELQFYGQGAGKLPTANSIVSDLIDVLQNVSPISIDHQVEVPFKSDDLIEGMYYLRFNLNKYSEKSVIQSLDALDLSYDILHHTDQLIIVTDKISASKMRSFMSDFDKNHSVSIRIDEGAYSHIFSNRRKPIKVLKFGGTSVASKERIMHVANKIIDTKKKGYDVVVVVSAMGNQTDELLNMAFEMTKAPQKRELDMLLSTGEQISISLLTMALHELKYDAIALSVNQAGILTDNSHNKARIIKVNTSRLKNELQKDKIVVLPGFQGYSIEDDITTLGRGGSDTTAVALSAVLNSESCEIYTDVTGVYTADPKIVKNAKKWASISYDEMLELATLGAQVMNPRSIELAKKYHVPLIVKSSFVDQEGTTIEESSMIEKVLVRGVTHDEDIVKISLIKVPDQPGIAYKLFDLLAIKNISIDMIIQSIGYDNLNDISFTVHKQDWQVAFDVCKSFSKEIMADEPLVDHNVVKLSIVGIGMAGGNNVASTFFRALYELGVNIQMISTSEIKISCIIENKNIDQIINKVHDYFHLGESVNIEA